ncbi:MAG: PEP-CTERM sorting domain-containing protein [Armatimonadetes bacterium]|nr:PEP-CTERM sorting domain-containing protein [Armatimonadota bacterium]
MRCRRGLALLLCLLFCCISAAQAAKLRTPPGSFFTKPVNDVNDVCQLISQDQKVAARFSKHYGMSASELVSYLRANTKVTVLAKTTRYTEYFVSKYNGRILSRVKRLTKGARILVALDGTPLMDLRCGNPFTKALPKPVTKVESETITLAPETPPPPAPVEVQQVAQVTPAPPPPEPVSQVLSLPPQQISFIPVLEKAALLIPLLGIGTLGGSKEAPPVVPEPSSLITMIVGGGSILLSRYRRMRRR